MLRYVFFATVFSLNCFAGPPKANKNCPDGKKHYRATVRHIESGGIGYSNGYTTLEVFLASDPSQRKITPFFDARGHIFDNGKWAVNAGVGLRTLWGNRVYGINTYYDYRNTSRLSSNQIGAGLETLGELFDFRLNGYLPVSTKTSAPYNAAFAYFSGYSMYLSQTYQSAMKGADAEFGFHFGKSKNCDFYAAAGPYYFIGEVAPATWGGKGRILGIFKDILTVEISDSYDRTFRNKFQGQVGLTFSLGPKSKVKKEGRTCKTATALNSRMLQPVDRQEIIVIDNAKKNSVAINPSTGLPYLFVFVDNTSSSNGTYESPYHSFAQAQSNSGPNDVIYVFPGNGTTTGMNAGITLQAGQMLLGSGVAQPIATSTGAVSIPPQSAASPTITNTDMDTTGNAVTLAANNTVSGFTITSATNDGIFGASSENLTVSYCTFKNISGFTVEATFPANASISITNNQFLNNTNGVKVTLDGTSTLTCSNNTFDGQTSVSEFPVEITANSNVIAAYFSNNAFSNNTTGSIHVALTNVVDADITVLTNTFTSNGTGSASSLGSNIVIFPTGTIDDCSIVLEGNTFSDNTSNSLYLYTAGEFRTLAITASTNTMSNNGNSALILATPVTDTLTLLATDNNISGLNDNGISVEADGTTATGNITINNNTITNIENASNGISIAQTFTNLNLTILNNVIKECDGTGIVCYANDEFTNMSANISSNVVSNCQNNGGNGASGISLDTYVNLTSTVANNTLSDNASPGVAIGLYTSGNPAVCLTLTGNSSDTDPGYSLTNPGSGAFNLSPCDVGTVNTGTIDTSGTITSVQSCSDATPCPP